MLFLESHNICLETEESNLSYLLLNGKLYETGIVLPERLKSFFLSQEFLSWEKRLFCENLFVFLQNKLVAYNFQFDKLI